MSSTRGIPVFIALLTYVKPLEDVERYLGEHVQFLDKYYGKEKFVFSGRRNPRTGGVILLNANTETEVTKIMKEDPFAQHNIAKYDLVEFGPSKYDVRFACFVD